MNRGSAIPKSRTYSKRVAPVKHHRPHRAEFEGEEFYCVSEQPFAPGAQLECDVTFPDDSNGSRTLHCRVEVVRIEVRGLSPGFGIVCRLRK